MAFNIGLKFNVKCNGKTNVLKLCRETAGETEKSVVLPTVVCSKIRQNIFAL